MWAVLVNNAEESQLQKQGLPMYSTEEKTDMTLIGTLLAISAIPGKLFVGCHL